MSEQIASDGDPEPLSSVEEEHKPHTSLTLSHLAGLLDAVNQSSSTSRNSWLFFLVILTYLFVAVASVTHKDLLLDAPIKLPLLGVEVALSRFFSFAPFFVLLIHAGLAESLAHINVRLAHDRDRVLQATPRAIQFSRHAANIPSPHGFVGRGRSELPWGDARRPRQDLIVRGVRPKGSRPESQFGCWPVTESKMSRPPGPSLRPANANFSSGPCAKRPGWTPQALENAFLGRSHRAKEGRARLKLAIDKTKGMLGVPEDYLCAIVPGSDTGAFEMAMWSLLGARGVDVLAWESFGKGWVTDIVKQLRLEDARLLEAGYGLLPDLGAVDFARDVVFTANGTTSGVRVPDYGWIARDRTGLTLVDGTSAAFAQPVDWTKVDVFTFSWQKALGGEAAHGMLILSPRAALRLESYTPPWPMPKLFRLTKGGKLMREIFEGETINTPSMLAVEDYLDALAWAESVGGRAGLMARADGNARVLFDWVARTPWAGNLAVEPGTRSNTSVCLKIVDPAVSALAAGRQGAFAKTMAARLDEEGVAKDIAYYRDAPPGLRVWTGCTIERADLEALTPWLDWAFAEAKVALAKAA